MCSIQTCEENDWILGATGICNNNTSLCECPEGFTGRTPYIVYNDCHVNIAVFEVCCAVAMLACLLGFFCTLYYLFVVVSKIQHLESLQRRSLAFEASRSQGVETFKQKSEHQSSGSSSREVGRNNHGLSRKTRNTKLSLITVCSFSGTLIFAVPQNWALADSNGELDYDLSLQVWLCSGVSWALFWMGTWNTLYTFTQTLPDWIMLSRLHGIKSILVRNPRGKFLS